MDQIQVRVTGRSGFVTIPRHLTEWDGLDPYDLRVGLWFSTHTDEFMDLITLRGAARKLHMSHERVGKSLERLKALGVVEIDPSGPRGAWRLIFHVDLWENLGLVATRPVTGRQTTRSGRQTDTKEEQEESKENITTFAFDQFWDLYPRKTGKGRAREEYAKALKKVGADRILLRLEGFAAERAGKDQQFTCHPATWLHQERWDDEPEQGNGLKHSTRTVTRQRPGPDGSMISFETTESYIAEKDRPPRPSPNAVWYEADEAWTEYV